MHTSGWGWDSCFGLLWFGCGSHAFRPHRDACQGCELLRSKQSTLVPGVEPYSPVSSFKTHPLVGLAFWHNNLVPSFRKS